MRVKKFIFLLFVIFTGGAAWAGSVAVTGNFFDLTTIEDFYHDLGQTTKTGSSVGTLNLDDVSLLWAVQPAFPYQLGDLVAMQSLLNRGGRIVFMGEHGGYRPKENLRLNNAISFLGGHITIQNLSPDPDFRVAAKDDGQILDHPLTVGVDTFEYACFAPLLLSGNAQALMRGQDDPTDIMMAYEAIGNGSIVVFADENGWDNERTGWPSGVDNARFFANLLPSSGGSAVPEPSTYGLLGALALLGLVALRRARAK